MGGPDVGGYGLSDDEAAQRLARDGRNVLPSPRGPGLRRQLAAQLVNPFAILLWIGAVLAWVAGMPQLTGAIAAVVVVNALFSFLQEARADRAAARLRALLPARVAVRRGGREREIDATEVVRDDLLLLRAGARVSADATVLAGTALLMDTSTFTGESVPATVEVADSVFAGTFVVEGEGVARVTAIGSATKMAEITRLTMTRREHHTPLSRALRRFVRTVSLVSVGGPPSA